MRKYAESTLVKASAFRDTVAQDANDSLTSDLGFDPMKSMKTNDVFMTDTVPRYRSDCPETADRKSTTFIYTRLVSRVLRVISFA
jgi:hypothetical protein